MDRNKMLLNFHTMNGFDATPMVYIGRPRGNSNNHFGNPFGLSGSKAHVIVDTREEAIRNFEKWIRGKSFKDIEQERRKWILDNLYLLEGKKLICFCYPRECHGDIYLKLLEERREA